MTPGRRFFPVRRAGAIVAVLLLLVIGVIIAATVLVTADSAGATSEAEMQRTQSRAIAWSGVQAVMAELAEQREDLLDGRSPNITAEWDLFTLGDGTRGVVRLLDLLPEGPGVLAPENAKLDINTATAEMLALVPGLDQAVADKIIEARGATAFTSVEQLLSVEGVTPELLYGSTTEGRHEPAFDVDPLAMPDAAAGSRGLLPYLTVFSFDPNVQVGVNGDTDQRGRLRIDLGQSWSDKLGRAIAERFDQNTADLVQAIMESGQTFATDSELARLLADNSLDPAEWAELLDVFTTSDDQFLRGRLDVNTAPREVLACIPGITPEQAEAIANQREGLDADSRRSPTWLMTEGLLTPEDYVAAADWVTTRSMQWRVRLEVGVESGDPLGGFDESAPMTLDQLLESWDEPEPGGRLGHRIVLEAVIDVGSTRPRVAYLREITLLDPVLAMHRAESAAADRVLDPLEILPDLDPSGELSGAEPPEEDPFLTGADEFNSSFDGFLEDPFLRPEESDAAGEHDPGTLPDDATRDPPDMIDRRIGRWTTRKAGDS